MQIKVKHMVVTYKEIKVDWASAGKLRGFFACQQRDNTLLHQHSDNTVIYRYPAIQYKILRGHPVIIAVGEGIGAIYPLIMEAESLLIGEKTYPCGEFDIKLSEKRIGDSMEMRSYRFLTPWFALNQNNYRLYAEADEEKRGELLAAILKGNILSMAKGLQIAVEGKLQTQLRLQEKKIRFKNETMLAFTGEFDINYCLPESLGIGKSVSRGYGTIANIHRKAEV